MGTLTRVPNWEIILLNEINEAKNLSFQYGVHDCTIWAAGVVKAYSNLEWEASWKNKKEALKQQKETPMEDQVTEVLGMPIANILTTQRGDLVQKGSGMSASLGICIGLKVAFVKQEGICYVNLRDCAYSWRI